ncbi:cytochrome P450 2L1-like [Penaeus chinensis]|uniref:cytochrome P450 2L1-like n=1 Tax=Penaeus chinensis TaxID=139456 RepID=UPI001FB78567|nr:cytochrome P450 2L1-like [Penaeus chinensis]XP_047486688.1 cytochrome P450 2L1-like [Penaeus chinensis]
MLTEALLGILLVVLLFVFVNRKPPNLPPGNWGWPVIGCLPSEDVSLGEQVMELRKKHGDIVSWRMGSRIFIFFCDYKLIKSAFSKIEFADRPDFYSFDIFNEYTKSGIANTNGQMWIDNRRFALRQLKDLGMGKTRLEKAIQYEAVCLVEDVKKHTDRPGPPPASITVAVLNVIWKLAADHRFEVDSPEIHSLISMITTLFEDFQGPVVWFDLMPWLIPIVPNFIRKKMGIENIEKNVHYVLELMGKYVEQHQKTLDPENPRDYIDAYLLEMEARKDDPQSNMTIFDLKNCMADLFTAGSETTASTIRWAIYYLAKYPEIQAKVHKEIDSVVDRDVLPSIQQRSSLPYLEAVTLEIHRLASLLRVGLLHSCNKDTWIGDYLIPKGAIISALQEGCHMDPAYWEKPHELYPEHFLDDKGQVLTKKEGFLPFSLGRRQCPGESLARMELFVFLSALLQNFSFSVPEGKELRLEKNPKDSFLNLPKDLDIVITKRP